MNPKNEEILRPHSYDGIQEYDKRLPNWWLATLWGAVAFAVVYWVYYHELDLGKDAAVAVKEEIASAQAAIEMKSGTVTDEMLWKMSTNPETVKAGEAIFLDPARCVVCHRPDLKGMIGPNLIDKEWIHGGTPMEILNTVAEGVPTKGMVPWKTQLTQVQMRQVTAYILSFHKEGEEIIKVNGWIPPQQPPQ